jgi:hypothetical protein
LSVEGEAILCRNGLLSRNEEVGGPVFIAVRCIAASSLVPGTPCAPGTKTVPGRRSPGTASGPGSMAPGTTVSPGSRALSDGRSKRGQHPANGSCQPKAPDAGLPTRPAPLPRLAL